MVKIGYIVGPNLEYANLQFYAQRLKEKAGYENAIFEIKKKIVNKNDSESLYIVVYATLDKCKQVDKEM